MRRGFSLIEVLCVLGVIALLVSLLVPGLAGARAAARAAACMSNQRQMAAGWTLYAGDYRDRVMPLAYWEASDIGPGPQVFWWGTHGTATEAPDYARGFLGPYLDAGLRPGSVFECPSQGWGTYRPQGPAKSPTSTYGYNGYYLSPRKTPGWGLSIGHRPWRRLGDIAGPATLIVFADALLPGSPMPANSALLDPPRLYSGGSWVVNGSPTTAFRHAWSGRSGGASVVAANADGGVRAITLQPGWLTHPSQGIGSVGAANDPRYVPDWQDW